MTKELTRQAQTTLGLIFDPFAPDINLDLPIESWQPQFQLIQHLTLFSQSMMVLTSNDGGGKSVFSRQLKKYLPNTIELSTIDAKDPVTLSDFKLSLCQLVSISPVKQSNSESIERIVSKTQNDKQQRLLVIDNAHLLPADILSFLLQLTQAQHTSSFFHILLLASPMITHQLAKFNLPDSDALLHRFELPVFNLKEMHTYLLHRLKAAGFSGEFPLPTAQLTRLYKQSNGSFSELHILTVNLLNRLYSPNDSRLALLKQKKVMLSGVAASVVGVFLLMLTLFTGHTDFRKSKTLSLPLKASQMHATKGEALSSKPAGTTVFKPAFTVSQPIDLDKTSKKQSTHTPLAEKTVKGAELKQKTLLVKTPKIKKIQPIHLVVTPSASPVASVEAKPAAINASLSKGGAAAKRKITNKRSIKRKVKKTAALVKATSNKPVKPAKTVVATSQQAETFGIQILASSQLDSIKSFINQHKLRKKTRYFQTTRQGKSWYVLVYGDYENLSLAKKARKRLPSNLKQYSPWPRSLKSLGRAKRLTVG